MTHEELQNIIQKHLQALQSELDEKRAAVVQMVASIEVEVRSDRVVTYRQTTEVTT